MEKKKKVKKIKSVGQLKNIVENMIYQSAGLNIILDINENKLFISANLCAKMNLLIKNNYIEIFSIRGKNEYALIPCHKDFGDQVNPFITCEENDEYPISYNLSDEPNGYGMVHYLFDGNMDDMKDRYIFNVIPKTLNDEKGVTRHYFKLQCTD